MSYFIWKYVDYTTATAKHAFESEDAKLPICKRNGDPKNFGRWANFPARLARLPECKLCLQFRNKENQLHNM